MSAAAVTGPTVLDASAVLALLNAEPGGEVTRQALRQGATLGAANLAEVIAKLLDGGLSLAEADEVVDALGVRLAAVEPGDGRLAGHLRQATGGAGLSLGDRACLALATRLGLPVLTAERRWLGLVPGIAVVLIR
ncbi:MAG: type II toxin-antitoxin system VapC family toxin [Chloroflexi bacterium]|nr:type II toxin-antitoxin system VapC family toxin [Chloroflexota bacterium]